MELGGKVVLLTGASTGLGPHIARRLRRCGAKFVLSARNEEALNKLAADLGDSRVVVADLSRAGEPERLAREAGDVDILIANAGIPATGRLVTFTLEEVDRALAVNFRSAVVLSHALLPAMLARKSGHIVVMSSVAGHIPAGGTFVSEAGMWAVTGLKPDPVAGEVTPAQVADAVFTAIARNRPEIDVMPVQLKGSLKIQALAPRLFRSVGRATGATRPNEALTERQRDKR